MTIIGESAPEGQVSISIHSTPEIFVTATTDKYGDYVYNLDTSVLDFGNHLTKSKTLKTGEISPFGKSVAFSVGDKTVLAPTIVSSVTNNSKNQTSCNSTIDLNSDCRVNLVDYSISAFWYKKKNPPASVDLNHDGVVNLVDFSIMAYYWTI